MKKITIQTTLFAGLMAVLASAAVQAQEVGKVISSTPIIQQVAVPRQVCNNQEVVTGGQKSGAGAAMGAIAGGVIGNQMGKGSGNAAATMLAAALPEPWPIWLPMTPPAIAPMAAPAPDF